MEAAARLESWFADPGHAPAVVGAWLFGSHAEGGAHRESDVDVGILLDRNRLPARSERAAAAEYITGDLMQALRTNSVDLAVLNDAPPLFARHILATGVMLVERNAATVHDFVRNTYLRAADVQPFVERGRRRILEELLR